MAQVAVVKCRDYTQGQVDKAVREALELIGGLETLVKPGRRVLLKVNALTMRKPEQAVTTHPAVIKAVAREVRRVGGIPLVGDSSGGMMAGQAPTGQTFEIAGIAKAAAESGAELVNFDTAGVLAIESDGPVKVLHMAKPVLEADVVISLPKLKTHSATVFTGAVKNMYGCIPGHRKAEYHRMVPKIRDFAGLLVDIFAAARPALAVMDGIVGMEGNGPSAGNPRDIGVVLASTDCVALDATACRIIGLDPARVYTNITADARGLGVMNADRIRVLGEPLENVQMSDFDLPSNAMLETMPGFIIRGLLGMVRARPEIESGACAGCRFCVDSCPVKAMHMEGRAPKIDYRKCIACLCCQELCPQRAVQLKPVHPLGRMVAGIMGHGRKRRRGR